MTKRLLIADTTLRDGAQTVGAHFSPDAKLKVAEQLVRLGVDCIEIGTPVAAPGELETAARAGELLKDAPVLLAAFARAREGDIDLAFEGVGRHPHSMLNLLTSVSDIHIESKFKSDRGRMLEVFAKMVRYGAGRGFHKLLVYLEDGTRTDFSYLAELVSAFVEAGADIVSIPDTVGYVNSPRKYAEIFARLLAEVPAARRVLLSAHTHNDKGLAVANALAAIEAGAGMVECTVNGLGERAGNASLGALLLCLHGSPGGAFSASDYGVETGVCLKEYARTAVLVGELSGLGVNYNEPLVGSAVVTTTAGIHQDGMLKDRRTYLCYDPESFGVEAGHRLITFNVQSGLKGITKVLADLGIGVEKAVAERIYEQVILLAQQKTPSTEDIRAIAMDVIEDGEHIIELSICKAESGVLPSSAEVVLRRRDTGETLRGIGYGDGPFSAFMDVTCALLGLDAQILDYHDVVVGQGRDSQMQAFVRCAIAGVTYQGRGVSTDIVQAGCRAFMKCVNRHLQQKIGPTHAPISGPPAAKLPLSPAR